MSDLCRQCAQKTWGEDCPGDLVGVTTKEGWAEGKAAVVLCEGCGPCQVDPEGNCLGNCNCPEHGGGE